MLMMMTYCFVIFCSATDYCDTWWWWYDGVIIDADRDDDDDIAIDGSDDIDVVIDDRDGCSDDLWWRYCVETMIVLMMIWWRNGKQCEKYYSIQTMMKYSMLTTQWCDDDDRDIEEWYR